MKKILIILGAILGVILLVVVIAAVSVTGRYNGFVTTNEQIDASWAQVENVLQRRGGSDSQSGVDGQWICRAREKESSRKWPMPALGSWERARRHKRRLPTRGLSLGLGRLLAISEAYPELKSNENFIRLQDELAGSENRIAVERRRYK